MYLYRLCKQFHFLYFYKNHHLHKRLLICCFARAEHFCRAGVNKVSLKPLCSQYSTILKQNSNKQEINLDLETCYQKIIYSENKTKTASWTAKLCLKLLIPCKFIYISNTQFFMRTNNFELNIGLEIYSSVKVYLLVNNKR